MAQANHLAFVVSAFTRWVEGEDLDEQTVLEASKLLGSPTRRAEVFAQRYREVIGRLIEERCADTSRGRVCIYSWSRRAPKRYFPAALDASGTVLLVKGKSVEVLSWPLHRAFDLGVRGVSLPEATVAAVTPRLDGWQVNFYYDPVLGRWCFSTRYVLHNMVFEGGSLRIETYGETVNPLVATAERIAERVGLAKRADELGLQGWTLTFMVVGPNPASALRRLPEPEESEDYELVLVAARRPDGTLVAPHSDEHRRLADALGVKRVEPIATAVPASDARSRAEEQLDHPSHFLWLVGGDPYHPPIYEVKSRYYEDFVNAVHRLDAKSVVVLLTSKPELEKMLEEQVGPAVTETARVLRALREVLESADPEALGERLSESLPLETVRDIVRAAREGKIERALRLLAASAVAGLAVGDAATVLSSLVERLRDVPRRRVEERRGEEGEQLPLGFF